MVEESKKFNKPKDESISNQEEIDFNIFLSLLYRNKNFLSKVSIVFLILGFIFSFIPKKFGKDSFR